MFLSSVYYYTRICTAAVAVAVVAVTLLRRPTGGACRPYSLCVCGRCARVH